MTTATKNRPKPGSPVHRGRPRNGCRRRTRESPAPHCQTRGLIARKGAPACRPRALFATRLRLARESQIPRIRKNTGHPWVARVQGVAIGHNKRRRSSDYAKIPTMPGSMDSIGAPCPRSSPRAEAVGQARSVSRGWVDKIGLRREHISCRIGLEQQTPARGCLVGVPVKDGRFDRAKCHIEEV